ncbi:L-threonylcarbamoyladenylate synthase [Candidatus Kinetoplastidibacterium crithidiae]|uniref:L-threonylcarbamoyladenylate synthase n=1 Tax=Candidatus Kinetoplastidibacterium crithidiae TaxID=33056 RepID=UPI0004B5E39D
MFPTETVYGLGADAENIEAVRKVYSIKGRPLSHPVILHLPKVDDLAYWASDIPDEAYKLADIFWPGPLTLVLKKSSNVPDIVTGGQNTVGIRCPSHPVAQEILIAFAKSKNHKKGALAAPSANMFGKISPTCSSHVYNEFNKEYLKEIFVVDGGVSNIGIESTIIDLSGIREGKKASVLRPGHITEMNIAKIIELESKDLSSNSIVVSGSLKSHYATITPLTVIDDTFFSKNLSVFAQKVDRLAVLYYGDKPINVEENIDLYYMSSDPIIYARHLYAMLRKIDSKKYSRIFVKDLPFLAEWDAIRDRLYKAAAGFN